MSELLFRLKGAREGHVLKSSNRRTDSKVEKEQVIVGTKSSGETIIAEVFTKVHVLEAGSKLIRIPLTEVESLTMLDNFLQQQLAEALEAALSKRNQKEKKIETKVQSNYYQIKTVPHNKRKPEQQVTRLWYRIWPQHPWAASYRLELPEQDATCLENVKMSRITKAHLEMQADGEDVPFYLRFGEK